MSGEHEQNWYPIGKVGWFTQHIREGIEVTAGQLGLLQPALAQPHRLDDATVARIIRVHQDQAGDLTLFQNQADRWNAEPGLTSAQRAAVQEYEAGELALLIAVTAIAALAGTLVRSRRAQLAALCDRGGVLERERVSAGARAAAEERLVIAAYESGLITPGG